MVFTKQNKHPFGGGLLVDDTSSDLALSSSIFQRIVFIGQRHGHHRGRKTTLVLPNKLWKPTLASRAAQRNGRTGPELCTFPVLPFFWGSSRSLGCSQWVGCPAEGTGITHVQVLQAKPMATVCLFWAVHRTQTDEAHVGDLKHGIGPFLCITSIQHRLSQ
ncbi:hypothetical protein TNCV_2586991 [Trichonephila clavipes]|nr:hypothetical protein TNCV_2586991 [Trichonephila clavipes]